MLDFSLVRFLPVQPKVPFISGRKIAGILSILGLIASIFLFSTRNLNYGIDFTGGTVWEFELPASPTVEQVEDIRGIGNGLGLGNVQLTTIKKPNGPEGLRMAVRKQEASAGATNDNTAQQAALKKLQDAVNAQYQTSKTSVQVLGSKVSGELRTRGTLAVLIALAFVLIYIWIRFEWQFGLGAVIALAHDVLLTIGVFSIVQLEFNLAIVAAILTIVGYSLNDTVIVYDRIRENLRKYKKMPLAEVINLSINDTLSRTILTSLTTLLALLALYIWGGPGLNGFAFAMIWGVFVGTYSSIFIASPVLLILGVNRTGAQK